MEMIMAEKIVHEAKNEQLAGLTLLRQRADESHDEIESAQETLDDLTHLFFILAKHPEVQHRENLARLGSYAAVHLWADLNGIKHSMETASESTKNLQDSLQSIWRMEREVQHDAKCIQKVHPYIDKQSLGE
jgi:hypothetical protein